MPQSHHLCSVRPLEWDLLADTPLAVEIFVAIFCYNFFPKERLLRVIFTHLLLLFSALSDEILQYFTFFPRAIHPISTPLKCCPMQLDWQQKLWYLVIDNEFVIFSENSSSNKKHNLLPVLSLYFHGSSMSRMLPLRSFICAANAAITYVTCKMKQRSGMRISSSQAYSTLLICNIWVCFQPCRYQCRWIRKRWGKGNCFIQ